MRARQTTHTTRAFLYNARGDVTRDTRGSTAHKYAVNKAGRIRTLTIGTTLRATWTYDGFQKLRIKAATSPAATTHYIWDSFGHIIAEHNATGGAALKQHIWLGDTPLAVFDNTTLYYVHPDHLDRPVVMTNASAMTIAWQAKYDPFGNPVAVTISPVNNQRLPGQWFQSEDGLSYNWHRTYDPTLGRYSQADPLGFVDGPGIYGYSGQSAGMKLDALGLESGVIIWEPTGWGASSFGHASAYVGDTSFSFGPNGMDVRRFGDYLERNGFRDGTGFALPLSPFQENRFAGCLRTSSSPYGMFSNSCIDPIRRCLAEAGFPTSLHMLTPADLWYNLNSQHLSRRPYPQSVPDGGGSAPWTLLK